MVTAFPFFSLPSDLLRFLVLLEILLESFYLTDYLPTKSPLPSLFPANNYEEYSVLLLDLISCQL